MPPEPKLVLVVDDDPAIHRFARIVLEAAGFRVASARDGAEALASLPVVKPDLILLDLMMPVLDGWGVLAELRGQPVPPVVVLSEVADPRRALKEGATACLGKPVTAAVLVDACRRASGIEPPE